MIKIICILHVFFISMSATMAQPLTDTNSTVMWGIVNQKGDTSYLFGTFHEFGDFYFNKYPIIKVELRKVNCMVLESIDFLDKEKLTDKENGSWIDSLSKTDYLMIDNFIKERSKTISLGARNRLSESKYSPADFYIYVSRLAFMCKCNILYGKDKYGYEIPMEEGLVDWSKNHDRKHPMALIGLEPLDTEISNKMVPFKVTPAAVLDSIKNLIAESDTIKIDCSGVEKYRNLTSINYAFTVPADSDYANLLDERNKKWIPEIKDILNKYRAFIAVGINHLAFKNGLINRLINAGYKVFPIEMKGK